MLWHAARVISLLLQAMALCAHVVMYRALGADEDGFVTYGNFRNFVMLLPEKRLQSLDPSLLWFNAASSIPFGELTPDWLCPPCC